MRIRFDSKKEKMYSYLKLMKEEVQVAMKRAIESIEKQDSELARKVLEHDVYLDKYRYQLEDYCGTIIATQQPVASELKELLMGTKLAGIFERMGDHACHLVQSLKEDSRYTYLDRFLPSFKEMLTIGDSMLDGVMEAYFSSDLPRIKLILHEDEEVDALYRKNYEEVIALIEENPKDVRELLIIIDISRALERYGDYAASIGEWLYFVRTSEHIDFKVRN
jgi:phosphate transport system protein